MLVQIGSKPLSIFWRHHSINPKTGRPFSKRYTKCIIRLGIGEEAQTLTESVAHCHEKDLYNKCKGRKLSLKRAIDDVNNDPAATIILTREDRIKIWEEYVKTTRCNFTVGVKKSRVPKEELVTKEHAYNSEDVIN